MVDVDHEISLLLAEVPRVATLEGDTHNLLLMQLANTLESLCGTLKAAKRQGKCAYKPQLLLQGMSDNETISFPAAHVPS